MDSDEVPSDLSEVIRKLHSFVEKHEQMIDLVSSEGVDTRKRVESEAKGINERVAGVGQQVGVVITHQKSQMNDQVRERFLESLRYQGFNERRNQIDSAYPSSLKWIFVGNNNDDSDEDSDEGSNEERACFPEIKWDSFSDWLSSADKIYWISGKPGSGKTTLVKYILDHQRTKECLNIWSPGCTIASHYFWKPGSDMQRNMKGLLCSLLYQLLVDNATALENVTSSLSGSKRSCTDWSRDELHSALLTALDCHQEGVCLFLDGLDEIDPRDGRKYGIAELLALASELSQRGNVKLCLASRPDPHILEMRLSKYPRLRLQDLNHGDLMAYAKNHVKFSDTDNFYEYKDPVGSLVDKAEGVFLWLILATKSINEGMWYRDSAKILRERIDRLPQGLDELYKDMWARAGAEAPPDYRQTAALYFKLLLARTRTAYFDRLNIFGLMLATTPIADKVLHALDKPSELVSQEEILRTCQEVERKLKIYCVGLVEVKGERQSGNNTKADKSWYGQMYDSVWAVSRSPYLQFIHRTAADFLCDTELGKKILGFDTSSEFTIDIELGKAWFTRFALFAEYDMDMWASQLRWFRHNWQDTNEWVQADWNQLVLTCEHLANCGRLFAGYDPHSSAIPCGGSDFLRVLAEENCDDEFIVKRLKNGKLGRDEKSKILLGLSDSDVEIIHEVDCQSRLGTFRNLLAAGADPNWQAWETPPPGLFAVSRTPWKQFLFRLCDHLHSKNAQAEKYSYWNPTSEGVQTELALMAEVIRIFIENGARLDEKIDMAMTWDEEYEEWEVWEVCDIGKSKPQVFASISAYSIVESLTATLQHFSHSNTFLDECVSSEPARVDSSEKCCVFGKLEKQSEQLVLWETTHEMQTKLGIGLIQWLKRRLGLTMPDTEGDNELQARSPSMEKTPHPILNDSSWIEKIRGEAAIFKWLLELELVKPADQSPGILDWVKEYQQGIKSQQSGSST